MLVDLIKYTEDLTMELNFDLQLWLVLDEWDGFCTSDSNWFNYRQI